MENKKEFSKSVLALVAIVLVAVLLLTGLNFITAPLIAENGSAATFAPLYAVMPDAAGFDQLLPIGLGFVGGQVDLGHAAVGHEEEKEALKAEIRRYFK